MQYSALAQIQQRLVDAEVCDLEALEENRMRWLTEKQLQKAQKDRFQSNIAALFISLIFIALGVGIVFWQSQNDWQGGLPVLCVMFLIALLGFFILLGAVDSILRPVPLTRNSLQQIEGFVTPVREERSDGDAFCYYKIADFKMIVSQKAYEALDPHVRYRVYYLSHVVRRRKRYMYVSFIKILVNIEPLFT